MPTTLTAWIDRAATYDDFEDFLDELFLMSDVFVTVYTTAEKTRKVERFLRYVFKKAHECE